MNKTIEKLRQEHRKDFDEYEKSLFKQNIESVQEGLDVLLSIKGIVPDRPKKES